MFPTLSTTARAVTYYLIALALCTGLAVALPHGHAAVLLAMLTPVTSVLLLQLVVTRDGWHRSGWTGLGLGRLGGRLWPVAIALPLAVLLASEAVVRLTGLTTWHSPGSTTAGLVLVLANLPFVIAFTLGEEIGWRGYLGPLLAADGRPLPHLRTGLLHGIWHLPLVFLGARAYLTEGSHWIVVPIFLAVLTCSGPVYGWLREATGSVYPAMLLHMTFNAGLDLAAASTTSSDPGTVAALGREGGVATLVVLAAVALAVTAWRRRTAPVPAARHREAPVLEPSA